MFAFHGAHLICWYKYSPTVAMPTNMNTTIITAKKTTHHGR